jgi:hypothetical protein
MWATHEIIGEKQSRVYGATYPAWYVPNGFLKLDVFAF